MSGVGVREGGGCGARWDGVRACACVRVWWLGIRVSSHAKIMFGLNSGRSRRVRTYKDFVCYIKQLADENGKGALSTSVLDFEGKNMVLLWRPTTLGNNINKQIAL